VIEEVGVVVSVQGDVAEVETQHRGVCGGCTLGDACATSLIARYFGRKRSLLQAHNGIGASPGDRVVIALPESVLLEASFVAYLVPLLAMIGGAMAGACLAGLVDRGYTQGVSVLAGLGGFAGALFWLSGSGCARSFKERYRPRILRRGGDAGHGHVVRLEQDRNFSGRRPIDPP